MSNIEIEKEIAEIYNQILDICNNHSFAANKVALLLARDTIIREEIKGSTFKVPNQNPGTSAVTNLTTKDNAPQVSIVRAGNNNGQSNGSSATTN